LGLRPALSSIDEAIEKAAASVWIRFGQPDRAALRRGAAEAPSAEGHPDL